MKYAPYLRAVTRYALLLIVCAVLAVARFYVQEPSLTQFDKIFAGLLLLTAALIIADLAVIVLARNIGKGPMDLPATTLTLNLARYSILTIAALMIFSVFGIAITPLLTALGVGSLAVAFGLQETLSNFFAGIYILKSQIIRPGDYIRLDSGQEGFVTDVGLRAVHLRTLANTMIYVPTSKISQNLILNFSQPTPDFTTPVEVAVDLGSNLQEVEKIALEAAAAVMKRLNLETEQPPASVRYHGYDSGAQFTVYLRLKEVNTRLLLVHEFLKELNFRFRENGITFALPQRVVRMRQ